MWHSCRCFLLQQCLDATDPERPLSQTLVTLNLFPSHNLRNQPLCHPWPLESINTFFFFFFFSFFEVLLIVLINHELPVWSELFHWDERLQSTTRSSSSGSPYTYLPLSFCFHLEDVALEACTTSPMSPTVQRASAQRLLKMQNQHSIPCSLLGRAEAVLKMNGIKLWTIRKLPRPGEGPQARPCGPACPGFWLRRPQSLWLLESCFLEG